MQQCGGYSYCDLYIRPFYGHVGNSPGFLCPLVTQKAPSMPGTSKTQTDLSRSDVHIFCSSNGNAVFLRSSTGNIPIKIHPPHSAFTGCPELYLRERRGWWWVGSSQISTAKVQPHRPAHVGSVPWFCPWTPHVCHFLVRYGCGCVHAFVGCICVCMIMYINR